jgi:hypothetical protein
MRTVVLFSILVACILLVGYIEDPCVTEGLAKGCME